MSLYSLPRKAPGSSSGYWDFIQDDTLRYIYIVCPDCGLHSTIRKRVGDTVSGHSISPDGTVNPSVVCPHTEVGCRFHQFVKLESWDSAILTLLR